MTDEAQVQRRRRDFIWTHHPDRGGDPDLFVAGLRSFDAAPESEAEPLPTVVIVPHRGWPARLVSQAARRIRHGKNPPRVR